MVVLPSPDRVKKSLATSYSARANLHIPWLKNLSHRARALLCRFAVCVAVALAALFCGCAAHEQEVVVYTSQDQLYAEPIFREFERESGIKVRAVFDTESVKTAGLANRLRFEKSHPQCDLFWNNEELHTRLLAKEDLFRAPLAKPGALWEAFGYRTRRIVINTNLLSLRNAPQSVVDLTQPQWTGKVAMAFPLFGTTAFHFLALRQYFGESAWREWCSGLVTRGVKVVDGNSAVVRMVAKGEAQLGLTDWDDIAAGQKQNFPIAALPVSKDCLAIPNTIALVRNSPHPANGEKLAAYLTRPETSRRLQELGAIEGTGLEEIQRRTLTVDWKSPLANWEEASLFLKGVFVR
jgi:iron(III) transport system substrate-binding protein